MYILPKFKPNYRENEQGANEKLPLVGAYTYLDLSPNTKLDLGTTYLDLTSQDQPTTTSGAPNAAQIVGRNLSVFAHSSRPWDGAPRAAA